MLCCRTKQHVIFGELDSQPSFGISSNIVGFSREDKSPRSTPSSFDFSSLRIIFPVLVFGKSVN